MASSHEEAAGVDIEGGEAGERTCIGDDEECRSHKRIDNGETKMAGDEVKGGEVDETSHMTNDGEHQADTSMDETAVMTTANPPTDTSAPSQPSIPPERRDGQDTTGNAGAGMHQPNRAQTGSPRR